MGKLDLWLPTRKIVPPSFGPTSSNSQTTRVIAASILPLTTAVSPGLMKTHAVVSCLLEKGREVRIELLGYLVGWCTQSGGVDHVGVPQPLRLSARQGGA